MKCCYFCMPTKNVYIFRQFSTFCFFDHTFNDNIQWFRSLFFPCWSYFIRKSILKWQWKITSNFKCLHEVEFVFHTHASLQIQREYIWGTFFACFLCLTRVEYIHGPVVFKAGASIQVKNIHLFGFSLSINKQKTSNINRYRKLPTHWLPYRIEQV